MPAQYIIRLDDASEYMEHSKWEPYFELFDRHHIHPIIAVIPYNKDSKMVHDHPDKQFWDKARLWQQKGYRLALHGYKHVYTTTNSGVIGMNKRSEFAGVDALTQTEMLARSQKKFDDEKIISEIFVAPAHSFDKNTLKALKKATKIQYISDGFFLNSITRNGFKWIPQQLWEPQAKQKGVWTICLHPEIAGASSLSALEKFITDQKEYIADPMALVFVPIQLKDKLYFFYKKRYMKLRSCYYTLRLKTGLFIKHNQQQSIR
jgi:hypothetical protein